MGTYSSNILPNSTGLDLGSASQRWDVFAKSLTADSFVSNSPNPATTGTINLASTDTIGWRNAANNADVLLSKSQAAGALPADTLTWPNGITAAEFITATANPSATGAVRLAAADAINFRNNANGGDITGIDLNGDDSLTVGGAAGIHTNAQVVTGAITASGTITSGGTFATPSGTGVTVQPAGTGGNSATLAASASASNGGSVAITAGAGTAGNGGSVTITGGAAGGAAVGGAISLVPGTGTVSQGACTLNGTTILAKTITSYNGIALVGQGVPTMIAKVTSTGQAAAITTTTLFTSTAAGLYRLNYSLTIDTAGNAVNLTGTWGWMDAAAHTLVTANIACNTLGANSTSALGLGSITFAHSGGFNITYATALSGGIGAGFYTLRLILEQLG